MQKYIPFENVNRQYQITEPAIPSIKGLVSIDSKSIVEPVGGKPKVTNFVTG